MYKYKCSKEECQSTWTVGKGALNGFILTCPICGKGRGIFEGQTSNEISASLEEKAEEMIISVNKDYIDSIDELNKRIDEFTNNTNIKILKKEIESLKTTTEVKIEYIRCIS
jgi:uncharacterized Zn finger protein (UPF0148 family)